MFFFIKKYLDEQCENWWLLIQIILMKGKWALESKINSNEVDFYNCDKIWNMEESTCKTLKNYFAF